MDRFLFPVCHPCIPPNRLLRCVLSLPSSSLATSSFNHTGLIKRPFQRSTPLALLPRCTVYSALLLQLSPPPLGPHPTTALRPQPHEHTLSSGNRRSPRVKRGRAWDPGVMGIRVQRTVGGGGGVMEGGPVHPPKFNAVNWSPLEY